MVFSKDPKAGGSWFAVDEFANIAVLLNGAAQKHIEQPPYLRSRGLVLIDVISNTNPFDLWEIIPLEKIEPFTLILFKPENYFNYVGTGKQRKY
ncbi:MAG: NRDE family protein [Bacteroidetes bacterium]|nr:NRDE family protein [Bacteroidota bacterium]